METTTPARTIDPTPLGASMPIRELSRARVGQTWRAEDNEQLQRTLDKIESTVRELHEMWSGAGKGKGK